MFFIVLPLFFQVVTCQVFIPEPSPNLTVQVGTKFQFNSTYVAFTGSREHPQHLWSYNNYTNLSLLPEYTVTYEVRGPTNGFTALFGTATLSNAGLYHLTVFDSVLSSVYTFQLVVESVPVVSLTPINLTRQFAGVPFTMSCTATGYPLPSNLTWYFNGNPLNIIPTTVDTTGVYTVTSFLSFNSLLREESGDYTCSVSSMLNTTRKVTVNSSVATLQVFDPPQFTQRPPMMLSSVAGTNTTLLCIISNPESLFLTITWLYHDDPIDQKEYFNSSTIINENNKNYTSELLLTELELHEEGNYSCVATSIIEGSNDSVTVYAYTMLKILYPPQVTLMSTNSQVTVNVSDSVNLTCQAIGQPLPVIVWEFTNEDDFTFELNNDIKTAIINDASLISILSLTNVTSGDRGTYLCRAINNITNLIDHVDEMSVSVSVQVPPVLIPINSSHTHYVLPNGTITLSFNITSSTYPPVKTAAIIWTHNGHFLHSSSRHSFSPDHLSLTISSFNQQEVGMYRVTVHNEAGQSTNVYYIHIGAIPTTVLEPPTPTRAVLLGTTNITLQCTSISSPVPVIKWYFNDQELSLNSTDKYRITYTGNYTSVLLLMDVSLSDGGIYTCDGRNILGNGRTSQKLLIQSPPILYTTQKVFTINEGDSVSFTCTADGIPPPSFAWFNNRRQLGNVGNVFQLNEPTAVTSYREGIPALRSVLNGSGLLPINNGSYVCVAENEWGFVTVQHWLNVIPEYINYCDPNPCRNGASCSNQVSTFLCNCTEGWTGTTCTEAATKPSPPSFINITTIFYQDYETPISITCKVRGYPRPQITWYKDNEVLSGIITEVYTITKLTLDTRGIYYCNASNSLGTVRSENIYVKIRGLVQYRADMSFTEEFITTLYDEGRLTRRDTAEGLTRRDTAEGGIDEKFVANERRLNQLITTINTEMRSRLKGRTDVEFNFLSLGIVPSIQIKSLLDSIPVILTLSSKSGGTTLLQSIVQDAFAQMGSTLAELFETENPLNVTSIKRFDGCRTSTTVIPSPDGDPNLNFVFEWPEIDISQKVELRCPCGPEGFDIGIQRSASRLCLGDFESGAEWEEPQDLECNFTTNARRLCQLAYLTEPDEVINGLDTITANVEEIGSLELSISTVFMENLTYAAEGNTELSDGYLNVIDNLISVDLDALVESNEEAMTSGRLLQSFEQVITDYPIDNSTNATYILKNKFVVAIKELNPSTINDLTDDKLIFSVTTLNSSTDNGPLNIGDSIDANQPTGSITIPKSLLTNLSYFNSDSGLRVIQSAFNTDGFYLRRNSLLESVPYLAVGSVLVSTSFVNLTVSGLSQNELINISLVKDKTLRDQATGQYCTFWDYSADNYSGNWSTYGCQVLVNKQDSVICGCNHLTTFALLLDVSPSSLTPPPPPPGFQETLMAFSYLGCAISALCLIIIILTYTIERRLRKTNNGQLLVNMSCALLGLYCTFVPAIYAVPIHTTCVIISALLHYFFLASFVAMAAEATILYVELVKVFSSKNSSMIMKAIIVTWVFPLFVVGFSFAPDYTKYKGRQFCRPIEWQFYIGYITPFVLIYIYNWIMFFIIVTSICHQQCKMKADTGNTGLRTSPKKQFILIVTLSLLFGLGWGVGLTATESLPVQWLRYSLQIIFVILVGFQGLFIFIFYGLRIYKVRKVWLKWLYILTNQTNKAIKVDQSLRSTFHASRFSKKKLSVNNHRMSTSKKIFVQSSSDQIELKSYKLSTSCNSNSFSPICPTPLNETCPESTSKTNKGQSEKCSEENTKMNDHQNVYVDHSQLTAKTSSDTHSLSSITDITINKVIHLDKESSKNVQFDSSNGCSHPHTVRTSSNGSTTPNGKSKKLVDFSFSNCSEMSHLQHEPV